ncbi:MAG TPA: type II toxin-antitoxin system PemK/MazF family toxin [Candidatus Paceibacterota bacterium]
MIFLDQVVMLLEWCTLKLVLLDKESNVVFKEGEIWWCEIGMNVGREIYGKGDNFIRPVLIFKKFNEDMFLAVPMTSRPREGSWYILISYGDKEGRLILNQIKSMDRRRLVKRIGTISDDVLTRVRRAFLDFYSF